jgi:hypothetical protein
MNPDLPVVLVNIRSVHDVEHLVPDFCTASDAMSEPLAFYVNRKWRWYNDHIRRKKHPRSDSGESGSESSSSSEEDSLTMIEQECVVGSQLLATSCPWAAGWLLSQAGWLAQPPDWLAGWAVTG